MKNLRLKVAAISMGMATIFTAGCTNDSKAELFAPLETTSSTTIPVRTTVLPRHETKYDTLTVCAAYEGKSISIGTMYLGYGSKLNLLDLEKRPAYSDNGLSKGQKVPLPFLEDITSKSSYYFKANTSGEMHQYFSADTSGSFTNQIFTDAGRVQIDASTNGFLSIKVPNGQSLRLDMTTRISGEPTTKETLHKDGTTEGNAYAWVQTFDETAHTTKRSVDLKEAGIKSADLGFNLNSTNGGGPIICQARVEELNDEAFSSPTLPATETDIALDF